MRTIDQQPETRVVKAYVLLFAWALAACTSPPSNLPFAIEVETEYLCIGTTVPGSVCTGNATLMDEQVAFIASFLGIPRPVECIPVFWQEGGPPGCGGRGGCTNDGVVYSNWQYMPHELVHGMLQRRFPLAPPLLGEGLAEALSGKDLRGSGMSAGAIIELGLDGSLLTPQGYEAAGHFVAWMLSFFGRDKVLELYQALPPDANAAEISSTIASVAGVPFSTIETEYASAATSVFAGKGPFSCGWTEDEVSWPGTSLTVDAAFSCESVEDYRRLDRPPYLGESEEMWQRYIVQLPEGLYIIKSETSVYTYAVVEACLSGDMNESELPSLPEVVLSSWGDSRQWGFFPWKLEQDSFFLPGKPATLPGGSYVLWLGWVKEPSAGIIVPPENSLTLERL